MSGRLGGGPRGRERGAVLVLFALTLVVLMAMAAFAVDLGVLYSERRQDQSAADSGVLGGALDIETSMVAASEKAALIVRNNLDTSYTDAEWTSIWSSCTDTGSLTFTGTVLGTSTQCISFDGLDTFRVKVPEQAVDTVFANVLGISSFSSSAFAEASLEIPGVGGVLPFAMLGSASSGSLLCMRSSTTGQATPPCTGSESGNFGALQVAQWGNVNMGTQSLPCNLNKADQLTINISVGIDHYIRPWAGTDVIDDCSKPYGPNTLETFQGISGGLWEGFIKGDVINGSSFPGRLTIGNTSKIILTQQSKQYPVDNVPLWEYIPYGKGATVPAFCTRESFDLTLATLGYDDTVTQLETCLAEYAANPTTWARLFDLDADGDKEYDITDSPRYGIVPQFIETSFPSGASGYMRIAYFRGVFVFGLYFDCDGTSCSTIVRPGESTGPVSLPNGASPLSQVSSYYLPPSALPENLVENGLDNEDPWVITLSR